MKLLFPIAIIVAATLDSCDAIAVRYKMEKRTVSFYKGNRGNGKVCRLDSVLSEKGDWYKTCKKSKTPMEFATCMDEMFLNELTDEQRDTLDECWDLHVLSGYARQSGKGEKDEKKCSKQVKDLKKKIKKMKRDQEETLTPLI